MLTCHRLFVGVAYSMGPDWSDPQAIQHWPSRIGSQLADKVATQISYDSQTGERTTWGFLCDLADPGLQTERFFKLYIDPVYRDKFPDAPTVLEARRWYRDYLECIYGAITQFFSESHPRSMSKNIEFLFSVPTTWRNPSMIAATMRLIKEAGFEQRPNHIARITLTEAEAAAVYTSKQQYATGDIILVCDAGGGTTDVNVLKLASSGRKKTELVPLSWVEGQEIGSALLDFKMQRLIEERLQLVRTRLQGEPSAIADMIMRDEKFETFKCSFGSSAMNIPTLPLSIPNLSPGYNFQPARIADSKLIVTRYAPSPHCLRVQLTRQGGITSRVR